MPGRRGRITKTAVAALKRGDWITDDMLPGFKCRRPKRRASYALAIRLNGRQRWLTIGSEAEFTPDQARAEAERLRGLKRQGVDAATDRDKRKRAILTGDALDRWFANHVQTKLKPRTRKHYEEIIGRVLRPEFGRQRLDSITSADVATWHASLASAPTSGNRSLAILASFAKWCVRMGWITQSPCVGVKPFREKPIIRYPGPDVVRKILATCNRLTTEGRLNPVFAAGITALALTGARRSEIFEARWQDLDLDAGRLMLDDPKGKAHVLALPARAVEAIRAACPRLKECEYVFANPSTRKPIANFSGPWKRIISEAGVGHWRLHDLRHGFGSAAVGAGIPLYSLGQQLGHSRPTTTARYAHVADADKLRTAEIASAAFDIEDKVHARTRATA